MPEILAESTYERLGNDCILSDKVKIETERDGKTFVKRFSSASGWFGNENYYYEREIVGESMLDFLKFWDLRLKLNLVVVILAVDNSLFTTKIINFGQTLIPLIIICLESLVNLFQC